MQPSITKKTMTENDLLGKTVGTKNLKSEKMINNEVSNKLLFEPENI